MSMRIAVFIENRNGVGLTARILSAPDAREHTFLLVTADLDGDVGRWIEEEAAESVDRLLAAAAIAGGGRGRVRAEISRVAAPLGTRGRAIRQLAREESVRAQVTHHSARLRKGG
ncbi:hypothetical protein [Streptomyces sp. NPDC017230]|uniref:hypothetical protein n=1 Tax=unclassified Streptomyces TaxID=2593676 RepID=UPI0037A7F013